MGENLSAKLSPNVIKGAAAAVAIGTVAVPAATLEAPLPNKAPAAGDEEIKAADALVHRKHHRLLRFTGYAVAGQTSTFGPPAEGASQTADGGTDNRPCIALRNDSTLDHKHRDIVPQCDYGPGILSRAMDITGDEVYRLHLNPYNYPTDNARGVARELK